MARTWGPIEHPTEHDVKGIAADEEGTVTTPEPNAKHHSPITGREHYNATDGRHNQSDHQGWPTVDDRSGCDVDENGHATRKFEDGPGVWRQT